MVLELVEGRLVCNIILSIVKLCSHAMILIMGSHRKLTGWDGINSSENNEGGNCKINIDS